MVANKGQTLCNDWNHLHIDKSALYSETLLIQKQTQLLKHAAGRKKQNNSINIKQTSSKYTSKVQLNFHEKYQLLFGEKV